MSILSSSTVNAFGRNIGLWKVSYNGAATTFNVDQTAVNAVVVTPASGPSLTLAAGSAGEKQISVAAGGASDGGFIIVATSHGGGSVASHGNENL